MEDVFQPAHDTNHVEGEKAAEDSQHNHIRNAVQQERFHLGVGEHGIHAVEQVGDGGGRDGSHQQRQNGGHGEVEEQHLNDKQNTGNGGLEDTGDGTGCTTTHQDHQAVLFQSEETSQVGTDGGACEHDGCLGTHRSAEADGYGAGCQRGVDIVWFDAALAL